MGWLPHFRDPSKAADGSAAQMALIGWLECLLHFLDHRTEGCRRLKPLLNMIKGILIGSFRRWPIHSFASPLFNVTIKSHILQTMKKRKQQAP